MTAALTALWILAASSFACSPQREERKEPMTPASKIKKRRPSKSPSPAPQPSAEPTPARTPRPTHSGRDLVAPAVGSADGFETVRMSWYTMGTRTANGESVQPGAHNCAGAARYPMGSSVEIRNPNNGRTVVARINDRGGFESMGRALDCMPAVWQTLGFNTDDGVVTVQARAA